MTREKCHDPAALASEYIALGKEGTICPHGVNRFTGQLEVPEISLRNGRPIRRGRLAIMGTHWVCSCCAWVENGPMPEHPYHCYYCSK
jgi:hypothetical protein